MLQFAGKDELGGMRKGGSAPLAGGDGSSASDSAFCWRAACFRRGGNPPAPAFPGGETGKGRSETPRCRRHFQNFAGDRLSLQLEGHFFVATTPDGNIHEYPVRWDYPPHHGQSRQGITGEVIYT